ncbi:MAG: alpha/beta hydrolase family protein [Candidatus Geothermincolia bacterium]
MAGRAPLAFVLRGQAGRLVGSILLPPDTPDTPCLLLCHGIPSGQPTAAGDGGYEALGREAVAMGMAAAWFNFRGTGPSEGDFSLRGWAEDLGSVVAAVRSGQAGFTGIDPSRLGVMGFSGGAAASIVYVSNDHGIGALASLAAPADLAELVPRAALPDFLASCRAIGIIRGEAPIDEDAYYAELERARPLDHVARVSPVPLLLVHGERDETVPHADARRLFDAAGDPKELLLLPEAGHRLRLEAEATGPALRWLRERL